MALGKMSASVRLQPSTKEGGAQLRCVSPSAFACAWCGLEWGEASDQRRPKKMGRSKIFHASLSLASSNGKMSLFLMVYLASA